MSTNARLCECGCGLHTTISKQNVLSRGTVKGEPNRFLPSHWAKSRQRQRGYRTIWLNGRDQQMHVLVAEQALGKPLPKGAQVHHVDENTLNNANANLVICQDIAYHSLLHARARIVRAGGSPEKHRVCGQCRQVLPIDAFTAIRQTQLGSSGTCRPCINASRRELWRQRVN